jgi:hypothetical protein
MKTLSDEGGMVGGPPQEGKDVVIDCQYTLLSK